MQLTRREFTLTAGAAVATGLLPISRAFGRRLDGPSAGQFFDWKPAASGATAGFNGGGNALIVVSRDEALLIDTKNPGLGTTLRREVGEVVGSGVKLARVIMTHHHMDHSGGNPSFTGDLPVFGHASATPRCIAQAQQAAARAGRTVEVLEGSADPVPPKALDEARAFADGAAEIAPDQYAPTETMDGQNSAKAWRVGDLSVHMFHVVNGHTDNDVFVHLPQLNLIHTGDLLFHKLHPFIDKSAGATTRGWETCCKAIIKLCDYDTVVIPGHGEITGVNGLHGQIEYFQNLREFVDQQRTDGKTRDDIVAMTPDFFEGIGFEQLAQRNLGTMYDELEAGE